MVQYIACVLVVVIGGIAAADPWWTTANPFPRSTTPNTIQRTTLKWFVSSDGTPRSCQCSKPHHCRNFITLKASALSAPTCPSGEVCCQALKIAPAFEDKETDNIVIPTKDTEVDVGGEEDTSSEDTEDPDESNLGHKMDTEEDIDEPVVQKKPDDSIINLEELGGSGEDDPIDFQCGVATPFLVLDDKAAATSQSTRLGQFPWNLVLLYTESGTTIASCGASLIEPSFAVTAAHCVADKDISQIIVRAGAWDLNEEDESYPFVDRTIKNIIIHERYQKYGLHNDIAFIVLSSPLQLGPHIGKICIPQKNEAVKNPCIATGWGMQGDIVSPSAQSKMKAVEVQLELGKVCEQKLRKTDLGPSFRLSHTALCASATRRGQDTSIGDGGGPLFCKSANEPSHFTLVGIVSWGKLKYPNAPGVYTAVNIYQKWIEEQMMNALGI